MFKRFDATCEKCKQHFRVSSNIFEEYDGEGPYTCKECSLKKNFSCSSCGESHIGKGKTVTFKNLKISNEDGILSAKCRKCGEIFHNYDSEILNSSNPEEIRFTV